MKLLVLLLFGYWTVTFGSDITPASISLFNTGVDKTLVVLKGGSNDVHYDFAGKKAIVIDDARVPSPPWSGNSKVSKWISLHRSGFAAGGNFRVSTDFDLSGWEPKSVIIKIRYTADNGVIAVAQNPRSDLKSTSSSTLVDGYVKGGNTHDFRHWKTLELSDKTGNGWKSGKNKLCFVVRNVGAVKNPCGFRLEIISATGQKKN